MTKQPPTALNRRTFIAGATTLAAAGVAAPSVLRAQAKEIVVGAASSQQHLV